mgnify:CR=1 FL=1
MEVIYYCDDEQPPPMALWLMGTQVVPRNWSAYLHLSRRYSLSKSLPRAASSSFVEFGYRVPLPVLIDNFRSRSHTASPSPSGWPSLASSAHLVNQYWLV